MSTITDDIESGPTKTSGLVAAGVSLGMVASFLWAVPEMVEPTTVGVGGAVCLTVALWLVQSGARDSVTAFLAGILIVPASVGLIGGSAIAALVVTRRLFPVPNSELVSVGTLVVFGNVGIFLGSVLAVLGILLGRQNILDRATLDDFVSIGVLTGLVPMAATVLYVVRAGVRGGQSAAGNLPGLPLSALVVLALSPGTARLHLADLLLVMAVTTATVATALKVLPVSELLADTGAGTKTDSGLTKVFYALVGTTAVTGFLGLVLLPLELLLSTQTVRTALGPGLYGLLQGVATAGVLRLLLVGLTGVSAVGATAALVATRAARDTGGNEPETRYPDRTGPLAAGALVTVVGILVAKSVYRTVVDGTARQLPDAVAIELRDSANQAAMVYGEATFTVLLATILIATIIGFLMAIRFAIAIGYLSAETAGYSLASAGVFLGAAFGATLDVPVWLVFGGIVASLLVWDAGRFGTVLGREIGHRPETRSVELVHAGGTVVVGLLGTVIAWGMTTQFRGALGAGSQVSAVALVAVVVGILSFVSALR